MSFRLLITALIVPPTNLPLVAIIGLLIMPWWPRLGRICAVLAITLLLILSLNAVSRSVLATLEVGLPLRPPADAPPQAIVILSAGTRHWASEPEFDVDRLTLQRLRAGAALYRRTQLPILVSGAQLQPGEPAVAVLMAQSLPADFQVPVRWVEANSLDTWHNAEFSATMLRQAGIHSVWLVTHAWHERRAIMAFQHFGIIATAAPVGLDRVPDFRAADFMPRISAWQAAFDALHEWIGCFYYSLR